MDLAQVVAGCVPAYLSVGLCRKGSLVHHAVATGPIYPSCAPLLRKNVMDIDLVVEMVDHNVVDGGGAHAFHGAEAFDVFIDGFEIAAFRLGEAIQRNECENEQQDFFHAIKIRR